MKRCFTSCLLAGFFLAGAARADTVTEFPTPVGSRQALVCQPAGAGPFPAVVFNHGSIVDGLGVQGAASRGYDLVGFCEALAKEGYLAFLPIREAAPMGQGFDSYKEDYPAVATAALDHVKTLPGADPRRIALMGFSMGGLTSVAAAPGRTDLKALVLLAPAAGRGKIREAVKEIPRLGAPVLLLVEQGDARPILFGVSLLEEELKKHGKEARVIRYSGGGGHRFFYTVGPFWADVTAFLKEKMR
ncbi:MAG: dienelactone hydrolase family protein [Candidatus Tectomicrobia bacterium]|nr:dienelactone hydrolase family protein [Candidatus Tectomicrobia bacterium]